MIPHLYWKHPGKNVFLLLFYQERMFEIQLNQASPTSRRFFIMYCIDTCVLAGWDKSLQHTNIWMLFFFLKKEKSRPHSQAIQLIAVQSLKLVKMHVELKAFCFLLFNPSV